MNVITDSSQLAALIQRCTSLKTLRQLHARVLVTMPATPSPYLRNNLLSVYLKFGCMEDAHVLFEKTPNRNAVTYNSLISAYSRTDFSTYSFQLYSKMVMEGIRPSHLTFLSLIQALSLPKDQIVGEMFHTQIVKSGFCDDICVQTSLLGMYSNLGDIKSMDEIFFMDMDEKDSIAWNNMILGYIKNNMIKQSLHLFCNMVRTGISPTQFTFSIMLNACSRLGDEVYGRILHTQILKSDFRPDNPLQNTLIDMYSSFGDADTAFSIFRDLEVPDLISWNSIISGFAENGDGETSMNLFIQLQRTEYVRPDEYTFASVISAIETLFFVNHGRSLHSQVIKFGLEGNVYVASTLIEMYFKNSQADLAKKLFDLIPEKDAILWTEMINGFSKIGESEIAVTYFYHMQREGHKVDNFSLSIAINSATDIVALKQGEILHCRAVIAGWEGDMYVSGSLIDMYAKNGDLRSANLLFSKVAEPDLKCWNSMISGFAHHGNAEYAFQYFHKMTSTGVEPDRITFLSIFSACSHCGLVEKGKLYWNFMADMKLAPTLKHYCSMISLLSRAGLLSEAKEWIESSNFSEFCPELWRILLSSCVTHRNLSIGIQAADRVFRLEPEDSATHILLSNLYAVTGRWDAMEEIRKKMRREEVVKDPGLSWIEIKYEIHVFSSWDASHPQANDARTELQRLRKNMESSELPEI